MRNMFTLQVPLASTALANVYMKHKRGMRQRLAVSSSPHGELKVSGRCCRAAHIERQISFLDDRTEQSQTGSLRLVKTIYEEH